MPHITIEAASISKEKKEKLIRTLTKTASEITEIPETSFTVLIKESPIENWGIGGQPLEQIIMNQK